jgi:dolichyl-phosphate-mannose-protein mannosyltransferase
MHAATVPTPSSALAGRAHLTRFVLIMLIATAVRLAALPLRGTEDVLTWKIWMIAAAKNVTMVYGVGGHPPVRGELHWLHHTTTVDYPPVALYELGAAGLLYQLFDAGFADRPALTGAVKIPGLLFGIALTLLLAWTVKQFTGRRDRAMWVALAYWANPATILNGEVLGYLDPLMMLPAIAALVFLHRGAPEWAGASLAVAMLTKPQALLLAPILALGAWRTGGMRALVAAATGGLVTAGVIVLPYALVGALPNMWLAFGSFYARRDILSGYAANIWWVANYVLRAWNQIPRLGVAGAYLAPVRRIMAISTFQDYGFPNPRPFGTLLVLIASGWGLWRIRRARDLAVHALGAAFIVHAFFVLSVGVHEHHMMLAVPLLALAAALRPALRRLFWTISLIVALNMNLFYGIGLGLGWTPPRGLLLIDLSVLLSLANIAALVWHGRVLVREASDAVSQADADSSAARSHLARSAAAT